MNETREFFKAANIRLTDTEVINIYLFCGGVPFYLNHIRKGLSAAQQVDRLCFRKSGILYDEFEKLFDSLFEDSEGYKELVRAIARKREGADLKSIEAHISLGTNGGGLTRKLQQLEDAAFIKSFLPLGSKRRGKSYRVIDEYCYFYLKWIESAKESLTLDDDENDYWMSMLNTSMYYSWRGYAFEALCYKHIGKLRKALQIPAGSRIGTWRFQPRNPAESGAQIDLLFVRLDGVTTIVEIKYTDQPFVIDKHYYQVLQNKISVYKEKTRTKDQIHLVLVTANGLDENAYSELIVDAWVDIKAFFN